MKIPLNFYQSHNFLRFNDVVLGVSEEVVEVVVVVDGEEVLGKVDGEMTSGLVEGEITLGVINGEMTVGVLESVGF